MSQDRITPSFISELKPDEVFVFGSNSYGDHAGGAARIAVEQFGAVMGHARGLQGQCYAIVTLAPQSRKEILKAMASEISTFLDFARANPNKRFYVTPIGCGIAGFTCSEVAPMFGSPKDIPENVYLPQDFWSELRKQE